MINHLKMTYLKINKTGRVVHTSIENEFAAYRAILPTTFPNKRFNAAIRNHIDKCKVLKERQYHFISSKSTVMALIKFLVDVTIPPDDQIVIIGVFIVTKW